MTNRFGADTDALDFTMQGQVQLALDMVCTLLAAVVLLVWQAPALVIALAALAAIYLRVQASMRVAAL